MESKKIRASDLYKKTPEEFVKKEGEASLESYLEKAKAYYDSTKRLLQSAKEEIYGKIDEIASRKKLKEKLLEMKEGVRNIVYHKNDGVVGAVSRVKPNPSIRGLLLADRL